MSYKSPTTGKQYVLITAGGARQSPDRGDYVIAYALPSLRSTRNAVAVGSQIKAQF